MNRATRRSLAAIKFGVETTLVCALVVGVSYGAMRLAQYYEKSPTLEKDGLVTLSAAKADRSIEGQPPFFPTDEERKTDGYGNEYGRKLAEERENRKLGPWTDPQATVSWWFTINTPGVYEVELTLASDESEAGSEYEVKVCSETFSATVPTTGKVVKGKDQKDFTWQTVSVGHVELSANIHHLTVIPRTIKNHSLMYLSSVTLRLVEP